jgi:magnesium transporter
METTSSNITHALTQGFFQLYPGEAAELLEELSVEERLQFIQGSPANRDSRASGAEALSTSVEVFSHLNPDTATELIPLMEDEFFRELFTSIDPARGAALLARLDEDAISERLQLLPLNFVKEYRELMSYPPDSAGNLMHTRVTTFNIHETVEAVLERVRGVRNRRIIDICLVDEEGRLMGVVPLQEVAVAEPTQRMEELVQAAPVSVHAMAPREDVVKLLEEKRLATLPVVELDGKLLGVIRYDALLTAATQEASEDVQTMFGAGRDERALSKASFAIRKRLPWLEINLATAFLAASVVGLFEGTIAKFTALAVFLPVVAGQSGNTGAQALAVTIRGLSLREIRSHHWLPILRKELIAGFINGCVVSLTTCLIAFIWMRSWGLTLVIGISMIFAMTIASLAGALIPIILKALGQDPAQSSSIILTTVTDVFGFMSFLGLATLLSEILRIG